MRDGLIDRDGGPRGNSKGLVDWKEI